MRLEYKMWDNGLADYLFTEAKLSAANQGDIALKSRFNLLCSFFSDLEFNKLNFNAFIRGMQKRGCSGAYMNNIIKIAKHINKFLKEYHNYSDDGIAEYTYFDRERKVYDIFTLEEVKKIFMLDYPYERNREKKNILFKSIFRILAETGIRKLELRKLEWEDVLPTREIRIGVKNKTDRLVPISENLYQQIQSLPKESEFVITGNKTGGMIDNTIIGGDLQARKDFLKIEGDDKTVHKFRHFFATDLLRNGASQKHIQWLLGHKSLASTETYLRYVNDELRETVMAFSSLQTNGNNQTFQAAGSQILQFARKISRNRFNLIMNEDVDNGKVTITLSKLCH